MTMGGGTPGEGGSVVAIGLLSERPSTESPVPGSLRWFDGPTGQELGHHVGDYYYAGGIGTVIGLHLHALTGQLDVHITTQQHRLRPGAPLPPPTKERYTAVHRVPRGPVFWTVSLLSPCYGTEVHIVGSALPANLILGPDPAELWYTSGGVACLDV